MPPTIFTTIDNDEDKTKIVQIYKKHYGLMMYVAKGILGDHALAEDAVSDGLEKMLRIVENIGDVSCNKTKSLIVIIIERISLNMLKKQNRLDFDAEDELDALADPAPDVADEIISVEGYKDLVALINTLTPALKDVAVLSLLHDISDTKIAEILGISNAAVRTRLSRAKNILRNKLAKEEPHDGTK